MFYVSILTTDLQDIPRQSKIPAKNRHHAQQILSFLVDQMESKDKPYTAKIKRGDITFYETRRYR